jgi:hypothetical protein
MPIYLRQSTASQEVPLGHFVDSTDGVTAETALTIANTDIKLWLTGATTLANKNSGGATHMAGGVYSCVLDATDTATVGPLVIFVAVAGALAVRVECVVLSAAVYDTLFGATALSTYAGGAVASVTGDVAGKVLGGGAGTITGTGARVVDASGNAVAPAATALSTAQWTNTRAGLQDNLDAAVSSRMATYTQPTGFLAATFPTGTVASTTNITAGTSPPSPP